MTIASELARMTGLSRRAVIQARQSATEKGLLLRRGTHRDTTYTLSFDHFVGAETAPNVCTVWSHTLDKEQQQTLVQILHLGVAPPVALDMVRRFNSEYLLRHMRYAHEAKEAGVAWNAPGWFIASAREDRAPPLFSPHNSPRRPWYEGFEHLINS